MVFDKIKQQATTAKDTVADVAAGKIDEALSALNDTLPKILALGFSVKDFRIGAGIPPDVSLKLVGAIDAVDPARIQGMIEENQDQRILVAFLEALKTASRFKDQLSVVDFKGVAADIDLALPPKISVGFLE